MSLRPGIIGRIVRYSCRIICRFKAPNYRSILAKFRMSCAGSLRIMSRGCRVFVQTVPANRADGQLQPTSFSALPNIGFAGDAVAIAVQMGTIAKFARS